MNNIERYMSGDKRLQVVVWGMGYEQKVLVQKAFFALGWCWLEAQDLFDTTSREIKYLDKHGYTNTQYNGGKTDINLMHFKTPSDYPITSFTELMVLTGMHTQEEVIPYLNKKELVEYGIEHEENMSNNEFTKDMLEDGMFVLLRNQKSEFSKGYHLVLNNGFTDQEGFLSKDGYSDNLIYESDEDFDVVEVFTSENVTSLAEGVLEKKLTSIWKRQPPEEAQRLSEKAALQEDIQAMKERLKSMESKLENM